MLPQQFPLGLTVRELKAILADWPDCDADGRANRVCVHSDENTGTGMVDVVQSCRRQEMSYDHGDGTDLLLS